MITLDVARSIREIRKRKGMTQELLIQRTGISRSQIYFIESGRFNPQHVTLLKIAEALEVWPSEIIALAEQYYREEHGLAAEDPVPYGTK